MTADKKLRPPTRHEKLVEVLKTLSAKQVLRSPAELADSCACPPEMFGALITGRPELIKLAKPRALNEEECGQLYQLIGTLIETNTLLREHAETTGKLVADWADLFKGLASLGLEIENFAQFRVSSDTEERIAA